jgi:DNA processing protein
VVDAVTGPEPPGRAPRGDAAAAAERLALVRLVATPGVGPVRIGEAVGRQDSAVAVVRHPERARVLDGADGPLADEARAEAVLAHCRREGITCLSWHDAGYPRRLLHLPTPPPLLFVRGRVEALVHPAVAIVGSRNATAYGRRVAEGLAADLSGLGVAVVSGLARGVDGAAHRGALTGEAPTVAVVAGGVERASPRAHARLYRRILEAGGAVVGEYLPGTRVQAFHFPVRNRILAALSRGVVVVEAARRSGALITAARARELGREVMAVPGPVDRPTSAGTNALLRDGAAPVLEVRDVVEAVGLGRLAWRMREPHRSEPGGPGGGATRPDLPDDSLEAEVWRALAEPGGADEVVRRVGRPASQVLSALTHLEVAGHVRREGGAAYRRRG